MSSADGSGSGLLGDIGPDQFTGRSRYWEAAEEWFDVTLTREQREIHEAVAENRYTLVEGANSFGKTYAKVTLALAFRARHYPSSVVVTSGTYGKLKRTFCADAESLHRKSDLFGDWKWSPNPHIDVDGEPTWQFEVHSPDDPEELEGVHNEYTLVIVDEADKKGVDGTVIDSMESLISDERDRMVVVANPPKDETNVVYDLREDYHHLTFSSFDSHNVQLGMGNREGQEIPGLATVSKLKRDWERYNNRDWPGLEAARVAHEQENHNLDERWLRRRAGVMPTSDATKYRPFYADDVRAAFDRTPQRVPADPQIGAEATDPVSVGIDLARKGGDETIVCILYPSTVDMRAWSHTAHPENEQRIRDILDGLGGVPSGAADASGEGSGVADTLRDQYGITRFKNSEKAVDSGEWDNKWTESLYHLGQRLPSLSLGGETGEDARRLREDLFTAARHVTYERRSLKSGDVDRATPKDALKEELGRSPDRLDALAMAAWAAEAPTQTHRETRRRRGGETGRRTIRR